MDAHRASTDHTVQKNIKDNNQLKTRRGRLQSTACSRTATTKQTGRRHVDAYRASTDHSVHKNSEDNKKFKKTHGCLQIIDADGTQHAKYQQTAGTGRTALCNCRVLRRRLGEHPASLSKLVFVTVSVFHVMAGPTASTRDGFCIQHHGWSNSWFRHGQCLGHGWVSGYRCPSCLRQ